MSEYQQQMTEEQRTEAFRQWQVEQVNRETVAAEKTADAVLTIKTIVLVWALLTLVAAVVLMINAMSAGV